MKIVCTNCGKEIKNWEKAYFFLELPERGITEIKSYLKNMHKLIV
ncbi:Fe3+ hydroxamate ABC transporter substrate-binding protein [Bombilactobacillus bombi]|nr:Fe3+ hydroxamate ABC transporter substrate-binding protein [Bombilactobacillus bombi]MBA1434745.1 Fe3+ hydroxamate ABC transporter substrate-binding protein [Bombilactobacillus bombi]